jgi:chromosome segregation ATPase
MTVLVASFPEFLQFLKIVLWISIPLFLVSTLVVVFLHYRNKRKQAFADIPGYELEDAQPAFSFREKYQQRLQAGKEQFASLEKDFRSAQQRYSALMSATGNNSTSSSDTDIQKQFKQYELKIAQLQQALEYLQSNAVNEKDANKAEKTADEKDKEIKRLHGITEQLNREIALLNEKNNSKAAEIKKMDHLLKELQESAKKATADARGLQMSFQEQNEERNKHHFDENKRLNEQLKELHEKFRKLEDENGQLQVKLQESRLEHGQPADADKRIADLQLALLKAEQQLQEWKSKVVDAGSTEEILEEKKKQIDFLQNQLDQKIRSSRQLEQKNFDTENQLAVFQQELEAVNQKTKYLQEDRQIKEEELQNLGRQIEEGSAENRSLKEAILQKDDHIATLETETKQLRERISDFNNELNRGRETNAALNAQLQQQSTQIQQLEAQLSERQQLLNKLHADISAFTSEAQKTSDNDRLSQSLPQLTEEA